MMNPRVEKAFNEQINAELYSSYLYLAMAGYFESINLQGFANWMRCQAQEEVVHAMKFFTFIADRGGRVHLDAIGGPANEWESPLAAFQDAYNHEIKVTNLINNLVDIAFEVKDHSAGQFLQWFVKEQVEEEASADAVVQQLKLTGGQGSGLFMINRELATRVFTPPLDLRA
jgi:ferritin